MLFGKPTIARELRRREIQRLLHSTHLTINLPQIFEDGFVDTARGLRERLGPKAERLLHDPKRFEQFSVGLDYLNCALTVPNFELLYARSKAAWPREWVHLTLDVKLLERDDTLFCAVSAAQDSGAHVRSGLEGMREMFAECVYSWSRAELHKNEPTHPQAEVLVKHRLPFDRIREILVGDFAIAQEVERLAEFHHRDIITSVEPKLFLWPRRLRK